MGDAADDMFDRAMLEEFEEYIDEDGEVSMTDNKDPQIREAFDKWWLANRERITGNPPRYKDTTYDDLAFLAFKAWQAATNQLSSELKQLRAERAGLLEWVNESITILDAQKPLNMPDAAQLYVLNILKSKLTDSAQSIKEGE